MQSSFRRVVVVSFVILCPIAGVMVACVEKRKTQEAPTSQLVASSIPNTKWQIPEGNLTIRGSEYVLSLDQVVVKQADGSERDVALSPAATRETLLERMQSVSGGREVYPILQLRDEEGQRSSRKLLTNRLTLQIPEGMSPQQVAKETGLTLESVPDYAPGLAIFSASDPLQAWAISDKLHQEGRWPMVDLQLATQQQARAMPNDTLIAQQWHLKFQNQANVVAGTDVNIENAWRYGTTGGVKGTGIRVGIIDDGLQTAHPDFENNIDTVIDKDWNGNDDDPNPGTNNPHGTCCAGNVAARGNNNRGVCGTAPEAILVGMRLTAGSSTDQMEAEAMAHRNDVIFVKNNSWGPTDDGLTLEEPGVLTKAAFATATTSGRNNLGTIFLWAAGNGGYTNNENDNSNYDGYANSIYTIAVGAFDSKSRRSEYSERGSNVVIVAPSDGATDAAMITTVDRTSTAGYNTASGGNGDYAVDFGGTSSATPTAAGIVTLMLEKNPHLGWRDVQEILMRTAKKVNPNEAEWANNSAGYHFNHNYGAGLIDATAAVDAAATWVNRPARVAPIVSTQSSLSVPVPDNTPAGITRSFVIASNIRVEQVTVKVSINHTYRGDLAISLISPSGMVSQLSEKHDDGGNNYTDWTFSSVRHWGEMSQGTWTLKVVDQSPTDSGTLTAAEMSIFGTNALTPSATITSPANNATEPIGQPVQVDVNATGNIDRVELRENGTLISTDTSAPYSFTVTPTSSNPILTAVAYDTLNYSGTSAPVNLIMVTPYQAWIAGFAGLSQTAASADPDGDGYTNEQEFSAQTHPGQAQSALRISAFSRNPSATSLTITWQSVAGVNYQVQGSADLQSWTDLGTVTAATAIATTKTVSITPSTLRYFRVRTAP